MEHISKLMAKQVPVRQEQQHLKPGASGVEQQFLQELAEPVKIAQASLAAVSEALRWCMMKVGLRAANFPTQEEGLVLYDHLVRFYGGHTVGELRNAFDMAITGQLDIDDRDVKAYESFDCAYVSRILNAYRNWSRQVFEMVRPKAEFDPQKLLSAPKSVDWRESVQSALNDFYAGYFKMRLIAAEIYDQIVFDNFLNPYAYEAFTDVARRKLCSEVQIELTQMKEGADENYNAEIGKYKSATALNVRLGNLRGGALEHEVILLAKQMCVRHYFGYLKSKEITMLYEPA